MELTLPLKVLKTKRQYFYVNLNNYRNAHFRTLHTIKKNYEQIVYDLLGTMDSHRFTEPVKLTYTIYFSDARKRDLSNACSIIDKFTCDALVSAKVLLNDTAKFVPEVLYKYGGIDRENPRVEVLIERI